MRRTTKLSKTAKIAYWKHWDFVEKKMQEEIQWLQSIVTVFTNSEELSNLGCKQCFLRQLAFLIVSGQVEAKEIKKSPSLKSFWIKKGEDKNRKKIHHGGDWHRETMETIESHFLSLGFEVVREPNLPHGRADLGVFKNGVPDLYVEVGTITSFYKILLNLKAMRNFVYLLVPYDNYLVEFRKTSTDSPAVDFDQLRDIHRQFHSGKNLK